MAISKAQLKAKYYASKAMTRANELSQESVNKFGGKKSDYMSQALKMAWYEIKNPAPVTKKTKRVDWSDVVLVALIMLMVVGMGGLISLLFINLAVTVNTGFWLVVGGLAFAIVKIVYTGINHLINDCYIYAY